MPAPPLERHAEISGSPRSPTQHAVTTPRELAREPAERFVVELLHRRAGDDLHLCRRDPSLRVLEQRRRNMCLSQRPGRVDPIALIGHHDGTYEGDRRRGWALGRIEGW